MPLLYLLCTKSFVVNKKRCFFSFQLHVKQPTQLCNSLLQLLIRDNTFTVNPFFSVYHTILIKAVWEGNVGTGTIFAAGCSLFAALSSVARNLTATLD